MKRALSYHEMMGRLTGGSESLFFPLKISGKHFHSENTIVFVHCVMRINKHFLNVVGVTGRMYSCPGGGRLKEGEW